MGVRYWLVGLALLVLLVMVAMPSRDGVVFLDVGQGDAILIQEGSRQILVDGGIGRKVLPRLAEEMPFFDRRIEVLIATHPQQDHMEGFLSVLERYEVGMVMMPEAAAESPLQEAWLQMVLEKGVPYRFTRAGQQLWVGEAAIKILAPLSTAQAQEYIEDDVNNASVVARVEYEGMLFLLTGDAELPVEQLLVQTYGSGPEGLLDVDILKAGHHGSNSSTHVPLLRAASASAAVISAGEDNRYGHPHPKALQRLAGVPIWRTDQHGSVRFWREGARWFVETGK